MTSINIMVDTKRIIAALLLGALYSINVISAKVLDNAPSHAPKYQTLIDMLGFEKTNVSKATSQYQKPGYAKAITL